MNVGKKEIELHLETLVRPRFTFGCQDLILDENILLNGHHRESKDVEVRDSVEIQDFT